MGNFLGGKPNGERILLNAIYCHKLRQGIFLRNAAMCAKVKPVMMIAHIRTTRHRILSIQVSDVWQKCGDELNEYKSIRGSVGRAICERASLRVMQSRHKSSSFRYIWCKLDHSALSTQSRVAANGYRR